MAPIGEAYFPPLDRCLSEGHHLLSWKSTYVALSQAHSGLDTAALQKYLTDPQTIEILGRPFSPFQPPSPQSKSGFETRTSAVNVAPSSHTRYDIKAIKEDTLWLSKETNIDEVSALRITVLEWQTRPLSLLLRNGLVEKKAYRTVNHDGTGSFGASKFDPGASRFTESTAQVNGSQSPSEENDERHRRLLEIYLAEKRYVLKCSEFITFLAFYPTEHHSNDTEAPAHDKSSWLRDVGIGVLAYWKSDGSSKADREYVADAVAALDTRIKSMTDGSGWLQDQGMQEDIEIAWARSNILEMIHIMQITFNLLDSSSELIKASEVLAWFRFMKKCSFFDSVQLPYPTLQASFGIPLISLSALISLAILKLPLALDVLEQYSNTSTPLAPTNHSVPYLLDAAAVSELNELLIDAAPLNSASLAVMAWAIMMNDLRETALSTRESRETRQSLRAAEKYRTTDSDSDLGERPYPARNLPSLRRRSSTSSDTSQQSTLLEDIYDAVSTVIVDGDYVAFLASHATKGGVVFEIVTAIATDFCTPFGFEHDGKSGQNMRTILLDLVRASADFVDYSPLLLTATLAVLKGSERYWDALDRPLGTNRDEPAANFLQDKILTHKLYFVAMLHFPHEPLPFLELCRALAFSNDGSRKGRPAMWTILEDVDNFTCSLPSKDYQAYTPIRMQEEANFIELTEDLNVPIAPGFANVSLDQSARAPFAPRSADQISAVHWIPSGTGGKLMNDTKPFVVAWNQSYSPLTFMGKVLTCARAVAELDDPSSYLTSAEVVAEIIGLITSMLSTAMKMRTGNQTSRSASETAQLILGLASESVGRNQDIISVVFDIFEKELYKSYRVSKDIESMELLVQVVQFTFALLGVMPERVWPFLSRSGLLGIDKDESQLRSIVANHETIMGRYDFLLGCIRLYDSLVTDVVVHAVSRKAPAKSITRFGTVQPEGAQPSQDTMERVILSFTRTLVEVFESTMKWRFIAQEDRAEINFRLASIFQRILDINFSVHSNSDTSQPLTAALEPASNYIADVFLVRSSTDLTIQPLLNILEEGAISRITTLPAKGLQYKIAEVRAALNLSITLIRVRQALRRQHSHLEDQLFKAAPTIARIYAAHETYKLPVVELLDNLICWAADGSLQPPSLMGHLGPDASCNFLDALALFDRPLNNERLSSAIWRLLSAIISKRQQWFAVLILTGTSPRESFKDNGSPATPSSPRPEPLLNTALDALSNINTIEPTKALPMLEFVALAADFWPWVLGTIEKRGQFLKSMSEYAAQINSTTATARGKLNTISTDYNRLQVVSVIAKILSMYARYAQQLGNQKFAKMLVPNLTYLITNAIFLPSYNASLHGNLQKNFNTKFLGCSLSNFQNTITREPSLGESFFYDLKLANEMLSYEPAWAGKNGNDGFAEEMRRANLNLSVVESQVNLFHSWKALLVQLSDSLVTEPKFQKIMAEAAIDCLKANADNKLPQAIFERLMQSRADLAFTLMQRLLEIKTTQPEGMRILPAAWDTLRTYDRDVGSGLDGQGAEYYRVLLKIIYLALQIHTSSGSSSDLDASETNRLDSSSFSRLTVNIAVEILSTIVAQGFRSLTITLHENHSHVHPSDFSLLTAILHSALRISDVSSNTTHLLNAFSDSQTARCASSLFSWSDQLATSGDPIYGELSILFLLEMSGVPTLAESLAVEGVLSHILSTNLIRLLQSQTFGPFSQPIRMYSIWSRGVLPLMLNLLDAVGPPLAGEIAGALNTFPHQLERASSALSPSPSTSSNGSDRITLSTASEAVTLSLITAVLQTFRDAGSSAAVVSGAVEEVKWDHAQVKEEAESCLQRRGRLRERIVPTNEREELWSRAKPADENSGAENMLEEKVVAELRSVVGILSGNGE